MSGRTRGEGGRKSVAVKVSEKMVMAMSWETRQRWFHQEKEEFVRMHMDLPPAEMDAGIKAIAAKWRV